MSLLDFSFIDLNFQMLLILGIASLVTSALHGAIGIAGGLLMTAVITYLLDIKTAVTVMTCTMLISHSTRLGLYWQSIDKSVAYWVLSFGLPVCIFSAYFFKYYSNEVINLVFVSFLILSLFFKHWANYKNIAINYPILAIGSIIWGGFAGVVIGPGFMLAPLMLVMSMGRVKFVATMALIALIVNVIKAAVFGINGLIDEEILTLAVFIGLLSIPGNWLGKHCAVNLSNRRHEQSVNIFIVLLIVYFLSLFHLG